MGIRQDGSTWILENAWIRRKIETSAGPACTYSYIRPNGIDGNQDAWLPLWMAQSPFEATITIDGITYQASGHRPQPAFSREGDFDVVNTSVEETKLGTALTLICRPRRSNMPQVELHIRYEISDTLPLLIKGIEAKNIGNETFTIENMSVEIVGWARLGKEIRVMTDYYEIYESIGKNDPYYQGGINYSFPKRIDLPLAPGETMESFRCHIYITPNEPNAAGVIYSRILAELAPWTTTPLLSQEFDSATTYEELEHVAREAKQRGIELVHFFMRQLFTNCGDYIPRPDIFPNGESDMKRLVDYFHEQGVKVLPYCGLTIAWQARCGDEASAVWREHEDWQYLGPDGIRYDCFGWGNMCYQSPWGDYIEGKLQHLIDGIGFDGLHIDGPYHWLPCLDETHNHPTPESVPYLNWVWEKRFFRRMREDSRNLIITAPQDPAAMLFGVSAMPGGYMEEDYAAMGGMPLVTAFRSLAYDARQKNPARNAWNYVALDNLHGHSIEATEENPVSYDHAMGACFGYGHWGLLHGAHLSLGPKTEAILQKWLDFYRTHRTTLAGALVHLTRPDGAHPDAALHVNAEADLPAVMVAFNPSSEAATLSAALPLRLAGLRGGSTVNMDGVGKITLDTNGTALVSVELKPYEIKWFDIHPC